MTATPPANILILGGTTEATALAQRIAETELRAVVSFAGRVARPRRQPLPQRVGGFGGVDGLTRYLRENAITHVIDATHPFAAGMSTNAVAACAAAQVPLIALTRAPWVAQSGDTWEHVADMAGAVAALDQPARRVLLAIGRMHLADFAAQPQHSYVLRLIDPPEAALPLPRTKVILDRGPFDVASDTALLRDEKIEQVVSKNSGGTGARAKIDAARALGLPVIMIDRPSIPARREVSRIDDVMGWLVHHSTNLGV